MFNIIHGQNRTSKLVGRRQTSEWPSLVTNNTCWSGCGEKGATFIGVSVNWYRHVENSVEVPQKTQENYHVILRSHSWEQE